MFFEMYFHSMFIAIVPKVLIEPFDVTHHYVDAVSFVVVIGVVSVVDVFIIVLCFLF